MNRRGAERVTPHASRASCRRSGGVAAERGAGTRCLAPLEALTCPPATPGAGRGCCCRCVERSGDGVEGAGRPCPQIGSTQSSKQASRNRGRVARPSPGGVSTSHAGRSVLTPDVGQVHGSGAWHAFHALTLLVAPVAGGRQHSSRGVPATYGCRPGERDPVSPVAGHSRSIHGITVVAPQVAGHRRSIHGSNRRCTTRRLRDLCIAEICPTPIASGQ
jgi:hypothetical protein